MRVTRQPALLTDYRRWPLLGSTAIARIALIGLVGSLALSGQAKAQALPTGGSVVAGAATITGGANSVTIDQTTNAAAINWDSFNNAQGNSVTFVQPNASAVALNRVLGPDPSLIFGNLTANGRVFLINPNGVLFGAGSQVNVGGLVASTLNISNADFMAGKYRFAGGGAGAVLNQGAITAADGGFVALLGANVANDGTIAARFGSVVLAGGEAITLDVAGDGLLNIVVDKGALGALVRNGGLIRADGGRVLLTAQGAGQLLGTVVNNSGVIEARTIDNRAGMVRLLGDMGNGTVTLTGTIDASAPDGGDGGFIETSAAQVNVTADARVSTLATRGVTGTWLIDPQDFIIGPGGNISGATLSALLVTNNVTITTLPGPDATVAGTPPTTTLGTARAGNGDIFVNDAVAWTATPNTTTLRLNALRDVVFNAAVTATNGNIVACCGRDIIVNAALTTTNGSILLAAGRDVMVFHAITTTDGNITLCAGHNVNIAAAMTLTRGSSIPSQSLGLMSGLLIIAGTDGTGPGVAGGTLIFAPLTPPVTVTGPNAAVDINYNPVSYAAPTDFSSFFTLSLGASVVQHMLLFPNGSKVADGTTATTLNGFNTTATSGVPVGVTLVAGPGASAVFDTPDAGANIGITFTGYSLAGSNAGQYALAGSCCVLAFRTTGTITPAVVVIPPVVIPPVVVPPVVVPPVVVPPVVVPPVVVMVPPGTVVQPPVAPPGLPGVPTFPGVVITLPGPPVELVTLVPPVPVLPEVPIVVAPPPPLPPPPLPVRPHRPVKQDRN